MLVYIFVWVSGRSQVLFWGLGCWGCGAKIILGCNIFMVYMVTRLRLCRGCPGGIDHRKGNRRLLGKRFVLRWSPRFLVRKEKSLSFYEILIHFKYHKIENKSLKLKIITYCIHVSLIKYMTFILYHSIIHVFLQTVQFTTSQGKK